MTGGTPLVSWLPVLGVMTAVWLAAVNNYRAETRAIIERLLAQLDRMEGLVGTFWLATDVVTPQQARYEEARFTQAGDRLDSLLTLVRKRVPGDNLGDLVASIVHKATIGIEGRATESEAARRQRFFAVYRFSTEIAMTLHADFNRWPRKVRWW